MKKSTITLLTALCLNCSLFAQKEVVVHDEQATIFTKLEYTEQTTLEQFITNFHFNSGLPIGGISFMHKERHLPLITTFNAKIDEWNIPDIDTINVLYNPDEVEFLFISEYIRGSSRNKVLEIFNPYSLPISLINKNYKVEIYSNGSSTATRTIVLEHHSLVDFNIIDASSTFVLAEPRANEEILELADQTSGNMDFITGDDAIALRYGDLAIDIFGVIGEQPNGGWGPNQETKDHTLRRKPHITKGVKTNPDSFDPNDEWLIFEKDNIDDLGKHEIIITSVSNNSKITQAIELHPNPATDRIFINSSEQMGSCQLIDMSGVSYPCKLSGNEINISTLSNGVYQLIINTDKSYSSQRFTKY